MNEVIIRIHSLGLIETLDLIALYLKIHYFLGNPLAKNSAIVVSIHFFLTFFWKSFRLLTARKDSSTLFNIEGNHLRFFELFQNLQKRIWILIHRAVLLPNIIRLLGIL